MLVIWDQSCNSVCYQVLRVYAIYFGAKVNGRRSDSVLANGATLVRFSLLVAQIKLTW